MPLPAVWFQSKIAPSEKALAAGDGCHNDEAKALRDYLNDFLTAKEAAKHITTPVLQESDPQAELYRLWGLLCDALVELNQDRQKTLDLLSTIQSLPSTSQIDWSQLPGFGNMWDDMYRLHLHGPDEWEKEILTDERKSELLWTFESIGTAEARMYLQGIDGVSANWGYEVLNLICSKRPGLDVLMVEVLTWLRVTGTQLKESAKLGKVRTFSRPIIYGRSGQRQSFSAPMTEHWATWSKVVLELSGDESPLSVEGRKLALECHVLMD